MKDKVYRGKCPNCCPDGGACFTRHGDYDENDKWVPAKKCNNCGLVIRLRARPKGTGKPNKTQQRVIDQIVTLFGGEPDVKPLSPTSREIWISLTNYNRPFLVGQSLFGTIGPNGAFKITLQRVFGDKVMTDQIGLKVYLEWNGKVAKEVGGV